MKGHLDNICDEVWDTLGLAYSLKLNQGEETITDNIILYLAKQNLNVSVITPMSKADESKYGMDWEWWIGNDSNGWLRFAVQAKKLQQSSNRYATLNHLVGKPPNQRKQHDILKKYASTYGAIPLYVFYNHIIKKNYSTFWNCCQALDERKLGCTITPIKNVTYALATHGHRSFDKIHECEDTVPLRCLVCPKKVTGDGDVKSLFNDKVKIYENLNGLREMSECGEVSLLELPRSLYAHDMVYYPKKIMICDISNY